MNNINENNLKLLKDLYSEEDVKAKIVIPYFKKLGYKDNQIFLNVPIKAFLGRQSKTVYADLIIREGQNPIIIVEVKKPGTQLDEIHKEQAISYARQYDKIIPIAVVTNGISTKIYNVKTKQQIPEIPKKEDLISFLTEIKISKEEIEEAGRFIIEGYKNVQEIKNALNKCHDIIRGNDGLDPISSFDEVNKIIFTKLQEEKKKSNRLTQNYIKDNPKDKINIIFQDANNDFKKEDRIFSDDEKIKLSEKTILSIVEILEQKAFSYTKNDLIGLAYESFLPSIFRGEGLGQFFTPDRIKEFMIEIIDPKLGNLIIDPAFGSGGFLVLSYKKLLENIKSGNLTRERIEEEKNKLASKYLYGVEINPRLEIACKTNMYLHGDGRTKIYRGDGLKNIADIKEGIFDIVITNPPFGAKISDREILDRFDLGINRKSQRSEVLFLERCIKLAKKGAKIGIVLPENILMNTTFKDVRDWIDQNATIDAIFKMPSYAFTPAGTSGIQTSLVFIIHKRPKSYDYKIFMGKVDKISFDTNNRPDADYFPNASWYYQEFKLKGKESFNNDNFYVIRRSDGELLSTNFYKPKYINLLRNIKKAKFIKLPDIVKKEKYAIVDGPFGTQLHVSDYKKEGIPVIRVKNIGINEFLASDLVYISKEKHKELIRSKLKKDDIIIAKTGATFGKACLFPADTLKEANITASCCKISIDPKKANPYFIAELINSPIIHNQLERYSEKSAQPGFNLIELRQIILPDIPLTKQNKIADNIKKRKNLIRKLKLRITSESNLIKEEIDTY